MGSYFEQPGHYLADKLKKCAALFLNFSLALFITFLVIRILEFILIYNSYGLPSCLTKVIWLGLLYDIVFFLKLLPFLFIPFLVLFFSARIKRANYWGFGILGTLVIIIYLVLIKYFTATLSPLGAGLYQYSLSDISQIIKEGVNFTLTLLAVCIIPLAVFWALLHRFYSLHAVKPLYAFSVIFTGCLLVVFDISVLPAASSFKSKFAYNLSLNKEAFFFERSFSYFTQNEPEVDIYAINYLEDARADSLAGIKQFNYINNEYPFLRKGETPDVLGSFFSVDPAKPPNIVVIQVEGLGRAFSGPDAYLGSFTPFVDTLSKKGLYWQNFLASQGETFASLPSILASLPFGDYSFNDLKKDMPDHFSLINILKKNGYDTRFYCGFNAGFYNQRAFLEKQGIDTLIDVDNYDKSFEESPGSSVFTWGYADRELMLKALQMEAKSVKRPFISYIQTATMQPPYIMPRQQQYLRVFENHLHKLGFNEAKKESYRKFKDIYSTILYTDEALKFFFKEYEKLASFKNTIFIITGGNRLTGIPILNKIDRYHVPLLIYSPLLKRTGSFPPISSHLDITPTVLSFLKTNYHLNTPENVTWVGSGIDTAHTFRNIHKYPLLQAKGELHTYISGTYLLDKDELFSINKNLDLQRVADESKLKKLRSEFNCYKAMNNRFSIELRLMPDSTDSF